MAAAAASRLVADCIGVCGWVERIQDCLGDAARRAGAASKQAPVVGGKVSGGRDGGSVKLVPQEGLL